MEALTQTERIWYDEFQNHCKKNDRRYAITWHMRLETGIPTKSINYHLSKLVAKGWLKKEVSKYSTTFYYAEDFK